MVWWSSNVELTTSECSEGLKENKSYRQPGRLSYIDKFIGDTENTVSNTTRYNRK